MTHSSLRYGVASLFALWFVGSLWAVAACSSGGGSPGASYADSGNLSDSTSTPSSQSDAGASKADSDAGRGTGGSAESDAGASDGGSFTYVLIDDMETTTHGPIELAMIQPPLYPGYWYNSGAAAAGDTADPPMMSFVFTELPTPTKTLDGAVSAHAARQSCSLNGLYDTCGIGFEFAQEPEAEGGAGDAAPCATSVDAAGPDGTSTDATSTDAAAADAGDGAAPVPRITVPFDISQYRGIVFWGKAGGDGGTLDIKVQFPDTETDPRGGVCTSASAGAAGPCDHSQCYNSYALHEMFTSEWQEFTVLFDDPAFAIDPSWGYQAVSPWDGKKIYGINWQTQKNTPPDAGALGVEFWVDDVYFVQ
jgi:hypothetical protein